MFRRVRSSDRMPNPVRSRTRSMPASTLRGLVEPLFNDFLRQSFEMLVPPGYTPIGTMKNFISMRRGWAAARPLPKVSSKVAQRRAASRLLAGTLVGLGDINRVRPAELIGRRLDHRAQ